MASPSVTYTFSNSTTADATQVNQNFTDIINGITDGTKDLSISALTCAGSATLNGNVTLGNASADSITFTGSVASHIPVSANATYDFGAATLAMRSFYIGNSSYSIRLLAPSLSASYTLTLPSAVPSVVKSVMTFDASANATFENRGTMSVTSKTTTYTATLADELILCSGSAFTVTLPAAATSTGKILTIKKTDSTLSNIITVDGNASETIDGATTTTLNTQYESIKIVCDGSNWHIIERRIPSPWNVVTSRSVTGTVANPTFGTLDVNYQYWRRVGDSIQIVDVMYQSTVGTAGTGTYLWQIPTGLTIDSNKVHISTDVVINAAVGHASTFYSGVYGWGFASVYNTTSIVLAIYTSNATYGVVGAGWFQTSVAAQMVWRSTATVPISGWNG